MKALRNHAGVLLAFALALLVGCAQLGLQKAQTPEDTLRYAQAVLTGAYTTVGNAAEMKTLPADAARGYYNRLADPKKTLDAADVVVKQTGGTLPPDTVGKINAALAVLTVIADELRARLPADQTKSLPPKR